MFDAGGSYLAVPLVSWLADGEEAYWGTSHSIESGPPIGIWHANTSYFQIRFADRTKTT